MTQPSANRQWPPVRKTKKLPKWQRILRKYWPPIRFGLIIVAFLAIVVFGIVRIIKLASNSNNNEKPNMDNSQEQANSTMETTEAPTLSTADIQALSDELIAEADFIAAGYDYQKAITILEE